MGTCGSSRILKLNAAACVRTGRKLPVRCVTCAPTATWTWKGPRQGARLAMRPCNLNPLLRPTSRGKLDDPDQPPSTVFETHWRGPNRLAAIKQPSRTFLRRAPALRFNSGKSSAQPDSFTDSRKNLRNRTVRPPCCGCQVTNPTSCILRLK